ncbi:MAG: response regulator [Nitrosomonadales bacterium]|nr:response regulator [Nitrosomonadales bacterium]
MSAKKLRVLLIEASTGDAGHTLARLEQGGYAVEHLRVSDAAAMRAALSKNKWDVVLCSYDAAGFCGLDALKLMQAEKVDLPFLFLSHDQSEATLIRAIQAGAHSYISRDNLDFLVPAIEHALREARIRREHNEAQLALQKYQARLHSFLSNLPGMAYQLLLDNNDALSFPYVSDGSRSLLGIEALDLTKNANLFLNILYPNDRASLQQAMRTSAGDLTLLNWEGRIVMPQNGNIKWVNMRCTPCKLDNGNVLWEGIMTNISQSKFADIGLKQSQEQLRELSSHIQDAREQERLHIARDIHDDMGGTLTAIKIDVAWLSAHLGEQPELLAKSRGVEALVDRCIKSANNILRSLRPSVLDSFGVIAAIEMEVEEFEKRTGISCPISQVDEGMEINPEASIALFRILQEALTNIMKHAKASEVTVDIANRKSGVDLVISDNGVGLREVDRQKPRSFGLRGIQERVAHFNGEVQIRSKPGKGTTIKVHVPHAAVQPDEDDALSQQKLF